MANSMGVCVACQRKRSSDSTNIYERRKTNRSSAQPACLTHGLTDGSCSQAECVSGGKERKVTQVSAGDEVTASLTPDAPASECNFPKLQPGQQAVTGLLLKACEREEQAEERAETAEDELRSVSDKLHKAQTRADEAEASLAEALERVKLMELRVLDRCSSRMSDSIASEVLSDTDSNRDSMDDEAYFDRVTASDSPNEGNASLSFDATDPDSAMSQLLLEVESLNARLTLTQQAEADAKTSMEASSNRLESFADMVRGCAAVAFAGSDTSSRRLRHHLFRCLDVDADGFVGEQDLRHWYDESIRFLDTQGCDPVNFEALRHQLADALHTPNLPQPFASEGKISLMQLSRSKMGASIVCTLLNIHNMMQERAIAEWGAA